MRVHIEGVLRDHPELRRYGSRGDEAVILLMLDPNEGGLPIEIRWPAGNSPEGYLKAQANCLRWKRFSLVQAQGRALEFVADHGQARIQLRHVERLTVASEVVR